MSALGDRLAAVDSDRKVEAAQKAEAAKHPAGWEPGVAFDYATGTGTICSEPSEDRHPDWESLLTSWGFDPTEYEIVDDTVQVRTWSGFAKLKKADKTEEIVKVPLFYYKATVRRLTGKVTDADLEILLAEIKRWKAPKRVAPTGDVGFVVNLSDFQLGKPDGDGVEGTVTRILAGFEAVRLRYRELRKIGRPLGTLYVADVGDGIEGVCGNYPNQQATVQLNMRQQVTLMRRLLIEGIKMWAPDFERVVVLGVASNHTQVRQGGKQITDDSDDYGLAILESVHDALKENPAFDHVFFVIPQDEMVVQLDVHGTSIAWCHSHKAEKAGSAGMGLPQGKLRTWWQGQAFGGGAAGDADILVSGHFHHYSCIDHGSTGVGLGRRVHFQCPSSDGGSKWWSDATGLQSGSGLLTFVAGGGSVTDVQIV